VLNLLLLVAGIHLGPADTARRDTTAFPVLLAMPPWKERLCRPVDDDRPRLTLSLVSSQPNGIIDEEEWFARNDLALPEVGVPNPFLRRDLDVELPFPTEYNGCILVRAIEQAEATFLIYGRDFSEGRYLLALDPATRRIRYFFDFAEWSNSPADVPADREFVTQATHWADERDGVLYVSHGHSTYAASSGGLNAYVTALDPVSGRVRWRSRPLVCNSRTFEVVGSSIVCGYGFTAEPDYVYVLDRFTGAVTGRYKVKSAPSYLIRKDGRLFVRCYDADCVFDLDTGD
jgi:hypothetical protein